MIDRNRLREALFLPCLAMFLYAIALSFLNPAPTWRLWLIRHAFTAMAGIGVGLGLPFPLSGRRAAR